LQAATKETALTKERYAVLTAASQFDVITAITSMRGRDKILSGRYLN
jgi:hypothetical protein